MVRVDAGITGFDLILDIVEFQTVGGIQDGLRAFVRTLHERAGAIIRNRKEHVASVFQII